MHFSTTTTRKFLSRTCDYVQQPNVIGWADGGGNNTRKVGRLDTSVIWGSIYKYRDF